MCGHWLPNWTVQFWTNPSPCLSVYRDLRLRKGVIYPHYGHLPSQQLLRITHCFPFHLNVFLTLLLF